MTELQLKSFSLRDLSVYLRATGWKCVGEYPNMAFVFQKDGHSLLVPQNEEFADYLLRMEQIVRELEKVESRYRDEILADIQEIGTQKSKELSISKDDKI